MNRGSLWLIRDAGEPVSEPQPDSVSNLSSVRRNSLCPSCRGSAVPERDRESATTLSDVVTLWILMWALLSSCHLSSSRAILRMIA